MSAIPPGLDKLHYRNCALCSGQITKPEQSMSLKIVFTAVPSSKISYEYLLTYSYFAVLGRNGNLLKKDDIKAPKFFKY